MTRVAVLSDIHGNLPALEAVVADAQARGCEAFVNLGDSLSGPLWPRETADLLIEKGWPSLAGNHERQLLTLPRERMNRSDAFTAALLSQRHREWLAGLPPSLAYHPDIFLCHGTPDSDLVYFLHDLAEDGTVSDAPLETVAARTYNRTERLILCGHTHLPRLVDIGDGRIVANPGSVGLPAYDDDRPVFHVMETGSPHARYAIVDDHCSVAFHAVDYDHGAAATKADAEGRSDWAMALRTGRVR
jgi:predicted phosphodiesterase